VLVRLVHTGDVSGVQEMRQSAQQGDVLDLCGILIAGGLLAVTYVGGSGLPRILLAVGFVFFTPGRAIVTNWAWMANWSGLAMSVVLSLALLTLLATAALWAHSWKPMGLFQVVAGLSVAGLAIGIARRHTRQPDHRAQQSGTWRGM
jgi:hypothetical protein